MPYYESVFIARPDISPAQVEALTEALTGIVNENGGRVAKNEYWGLKNLAYRIKKNRKGHYSLLNIEAPAEAVRELERNMRINEDVLRYLTVRLDEIQEGPSVMMQSRSSRDDRGRGRGDRDRGGRDRDRDRGPREAAGDDAKESKPVSEATSETVSNEPEPVQAAGEDAPAPTEGDKE